MKEENWKIIIFDNSPEVHGVTKIVLEDLVFDNKKIELFSSYSIEETKKLVTEIPDLAIAILEISFKNEKESLELVRYIRDDLKNKLIRIILRTSEVAHLSQKDAIIRYDINDYKEKLELTDQKLFTTIVSSLRAYSDLITIEKQKNQLQAALKEKEILIKEIHHRVKNNLQIICSLLNMQSKRIGDEEVYKMFLVSRDRVRSMALIHENLYHSEDFSRIEFDRYIKTLVQELCYSYDSEKNIKVVMNFEKIYLNIDQAIPCGLIVNELITNSLKHAFPHAHSKEEEIYIGLKSKSEKVYVCVTDNGVGIGDKEELAKSQSLGFQLITILTEQLGGTLKIENKNGTCYDIIFPLEN